MATQNPVEQEGVYRLPEAQLDRFLIRVEMGYPGFGHEVNLLRLHSKPPAEVSEMFTPGTDPLAPAKAPGGLRRGHAVRVHRPTGRGEPAPPGHRSARARGRP